MNRKSAVSLGPGASSLILICVVLALAIMGMLSLLTARNDLKFSERSAEVIRTVYQINELAEIRRAEIERILGNAAKDGEDFLTAAGNALPDGTELIDDEITWTEEIMIDLDPDGSDPDARTMMLDCALRILPEGEGERTQWIRHDLSVYTEDEEWNW